MTLIVEGCFAHDPWRTQDAGSLLPGCILPVWRLLEHNGALPPTTGFGVQIPNTFATAELTPWLQHLSVISILFPQAGDGRGFSQAVRLRRAGFSAELRASGPLIPDQYPHLRAAGFDSIEVPDEFAERHGELDWQRAWRLFPARYQRAGAGLESIIARRHADAARR